MKKKPFITYPSVIGKFTDQDDLARNFYARVRSALMEDQNPNYFFAMRYEGVGGGYSCEFDEEDLMTHVPSEVVFIVKPKNPDANLRQLIIENCNWQAEDLDTFANEYQEANGCSLWDMEVVYLFESNAEAELFAKDHLQDEERDAIHPKEI